MNTHFESMDKDEGKMALFCMDTTIIIYYSDIKTSTTASLTSQYCPESLGFNGIEEELLRRS